MSGRLTLLRDYFPTAIFTGKSLVFISEDWRVELTEHLRAAGPADTPVIRVRLFNKSDTGEFVQGHYEDFQIAELSDLAGEIEKFVQFAVGRNIKES